MIIICNKVLIMPISNLKAKECQQSYESDIDPDDVKTDNLIYKFWTMNAQLPEEARIQFTPQPTFCDAFMLFSEEALLHTFWSTEGLGRGKKTPIQETMQKFKSRKEAEDMRETTYGELIKQLFIGTRPASKRTSYHRKLATQKDIQDRQSQQGSSSSSTAMNAANSPFSIDKLKEYVTNTFQYRQELKDYKEGLRHIPPVEPRLPHDDTFNKHYILTNMVRTNGLELQVLAFDLRKPKTPPSRYKMAETRVDIHDIEKRFPDRNAVLRMFPRGPENVAVVGIDPGEVISAAACGINTDSNNASVVRNLLVKRAALYSPILSHREAMNRAKNERIKPPASPGYIFPTVNDFQNRLCNLGNGSPRDVCLHINWWMFVFRWLRSFYSTTSYKRKDWDRKKAFRAEYDWAVRGLLQCGGADVKVHEKVTDGSGRDILFVYGNAEFNTRTKLASLHTTFKGYFFKKVMIICL